MTGNVGITSHLDNDQLDTQLLYFTIRLLHSSTCFEHYMLIIGRLIALMQHLVSSSQSVAVRCTGWERTALFYNTSMTFLYMFQALNAHHQEANSTDAASGIVLSVSGRPVYRLRENCFILQYVHDIPLTYLLTPWSRVLEKLTGSAASQEIPRIPWNPKVHYRIHKGPPTVPILKQIVVTVNYDYCITQD